MNAIDHAWRPKQLDEEALINAFPIDYDPISAPMNATIWDHPLLNGLVLQHDVTELRQAEKNERKMRA
jgi:hypothetical protein